MYMVINMYAKFDDSFKKNEGDLINHDQKESYRINKFISDAGYASRRESDRLVQSGVVTVNGVVAQTGMQVYMDDVVKVNGDLIKPLNHRVYIALNKPVGIECITDINKKGNIVSFMNYPEMIFPVGRLDKDSSGLILLTNDGDIVNKILRSENDHDKEYLVTVDKKITPLFLEQMEKGVVIYNPVAHRNQRTLPAKTSKLDDYTFRLIINQGLNRQIRRMSQALGYQVKDLKRIRVMNIKLDDLKDGYWRYLSSSELKELNKSLLK